MLTKEHIDYRHDDQEIWESELESWVPQRVYDCHMHMLDNSLIAEGTKYRDLYPDTDFETAQAWHNLVMPGRETHFLMLGRPAPGTDVYGHNTFMHREMESDPLSRRNRLTMPSDTPEEIERDVKERGFIGLKVYRFYSVTGDMKDCRIHEFLPHEQMEVASELGLWVTMHLSRAGGGDEENLRDLEEYTTKRYPGIRWILAHCGAVVRLLANGVRNRPPQGHAEHLVRHLRRDRRSPRSSHFSARKTTGASSTAPTASSRSHSTARTRRSARRTKWSKPTRCRISISTTRTTVPSSACTSSSSL